MKAWHPLAVVSGSIIALVMASASISYNATLGSAEPAFGWLPWVSNATLFSSLALAFDLGMIASVFGFLHWQATSKVRAAVCAILFVIASAYSVHSVRGYIALNLSKTLAPTERSADAYQSLQRDLSQDQDYRTSLRDRLLKARSRSERRRLEQTLMQVDNRIDRTRAQLARTDVRAPVSPLAGIEWFLAVTLWFFNATCWSAWFGADKASRPITPSTNSTSSTCSAPVSGPSGGNGDGEAQADSVALFLAACPLTEPEHCVHIHERYRQWARAQGYDALPARKFYARLAALGARRFRDGRNGPTQYVMPADDHAG